MKTKKLRTRDDVIDYIIDKCPDRAITRALKEGKVEFLGGFRQVPPATDPGWIVRGTLLSGRRVHAVVIAYNSTARYGIRRVRRVPWEMWWGDASGLAFYRGDFPDKYKHLKEETVKRNAEKKERA